MSLFDLHYMSTEAEEVRFKEQQKSIESALKELSISSRIHQEQEHEKLISYRQKCTRPTSLSTIDFDQLNTHYILNTANTEFSTPYDPISIYSYDQINYGSETPDSQRERTPSMISSSSYISNRSSQLDDPYSHPNYHVSERDDYGFKRSLWIKPAKLFEFEQKYKKSKEKQSRRWNKLFLNNDQHWPTLCSQLNPYVQKGIPHHLRSKAWMHYSGAQQKMESNSGLYRSLLETKTEKNEYIQMINKEKHRLFPDNVYFHDDNYQHTKLHSLTRVLTAFTFFSPGIGYCQSLGLLAAFILLVVDNEEEAFWLLATVVNEYFPESVYDPVLDGAQIEQAVFMLMVYEKMPSIWSKIANKKCFWECEEKESLPSVTLLVNHWFLTLFVNALPVETILRVWDCVFIGGGFKVIHQVALTLLKLNDNRISKVTDSVEAFQILQSMPKQIIECDEFIDCVFSSNNNDIFDLTDQDIESKRSLLRNRKLQREGYF